MLEERGHVPVMGVVPYMEISLDDEDSLTERFAGKSADCIDLAVIRYPRISNFTDFNVFEQIEGVSVRYITTVGELGHPDMVFLPGSKNTMSDLRWMRENGLEAAVKKLAEDIPVCGICGGYQMLGMQISDPGWVEAGGIIRGMELLPVETVLEKEKVRCQADGVINQLNGVLSELSGMQYIGYEIHMGRTTRIGKQVQNNCKDVVISDMGGNVYGSYIHGLFDKGKIAALVVQTLAKRKGIHMENGLGMDYQAFKEAQYDKLADTLREYLNMEEVYGMLRDARLE